MASKGEMLLALHLEELGFEFMSNYQFALNIGREWEFDFFLHREHIAIEVEGGTWGKSRHGYGKGFDNDCEKYNTATMMGYRVLRFSTSQVMDGTAREFVKQNLGTREDTRETGPDTTSPASHGRNSKRTDLYTT